MFRKIMTTGSLAGLVGSVVLLAWSYTGGREVYEDGGLLISLRRGLVYVVADGRQEDSKAAGCTITKTVNADGTITTRIGCSFPPLPQDAKFKFSLHRVLVDSPGLLSSCSVVPYYRNGLFHCSLWLPCLMFGVLPTRSCLLLRRRHKRKKRGLCLECDYDLRASRERCPECGTKFDADRSILKADR